MNDALRMQISAFVDDELPDNESELLLRRLSQDAALRRQAAEYLRIGHLIRRDREIPGMGELRNRIAMALGEQPAAAGLKPEPSRSRFLKPAAGLGIAASVAVLALIGLRQVEVREPAALPDTGRESATASTAGVPGYTEPPRPSQVLYDRPSEMLMQYYLSHGETSAGLGANGILTRLVTFELREGDLVEVEPGHGMNGDDARRPAGTPQTTKNQTTKNQTTKDQTSKDNETKF